VFLITDAESSAYMNQNPRQAGTQLIFQELPSFYRTWKFIIAFRRPCNMSVLNQMNPVQCQTLPGVQTAFS